MVEITKAEKEIISRQIPSAHIVRTMKQKSKRHHYYCEESSKVMALLKEIRDSIGGQKAGDSNGH